MKLIYVIPLSFQIMNKKILILILVALGFLLIPSISFACGSSSCCSGEKTIQTEAKACCNSKKQSSERQSCDTGKHTKKDSGCSGKSKHNSCQCISPIFSLVLPTFSELVFVNSYDFSYHNNSFFCKEFKISSGFYYIWTPPNIG